MTDINHMQESNDAWILIDNKLTDEQKEIRDARLGVPVLHHPRQTNPNDVEFKVSYDTIISRHNLIIGGAATGKTTLIMRMLKELAEIKDIVVFTPEYMHEIYKSIAPHAVLKSEVNKKELFEIANQHKQKQEKYKEINDIELMKDLADKARALKNYRQMVDDKVLSSYADFIQNRLTVVANREQLSLMDLTDKEKYILENLFFDCKFLLIVDEFEFLHKAIIDCMKDSTMSWAVNALFTSSRYSGITTITSSISDNLLPPIMRLHSDNIFFTHRNAVANYINKRSNNCGKDSTDQLRILYCILKKNYYKFVIYDNTSNYRSAGFIAPFDLQHL